MLLPCLQDSRIACNMDVCDIQIKAIPQNTAIVQQIDFHIDLSYQIRGVSVRLQSVKMLLQRAGWLGAEHHYC